MEAALRALAATLGTLPVALLAALALARRLPLSEDARFACGFGLAVPLWVAAIHLGFLARSARTAWLACGVASLVLAAVAF
jgi:hypothetical protein